MTSFEFYPGSGYLSGQDRPKRVLSAFLRKGAIPHALLFCGIDGIGKLATAISFAMACNCLNRPSGDKTHFRTDTFLNYSPDSREPFHKPSHDTNPILPCGECGPCRKIQSGNHPDIIQIKPSGSMIKIAQIRALGHTLSMKPYEALMRVAIISDAHTLNPEAGNALLKMLEEPPHKTLLILITSRDSDLLPTVLSRCQHIRFVPIPRKNIEAYLMEKLGASSTDAEVLSIMANGSYTQAQYLFESHWMEQRNRLIRALGLDHPFTTSPKPVAFLLGMAECLSKNKEEWFDCLQILKSWVRDLIISKFSPQHMVNKDMAKVIQQVSEKMECHKLLNHISIIHASEKQIQTNLNVRLMAETLILGLSGYI